MKKPKKALPSLSIYPRDGRAEAFGAPSSQELGWGLAIISQYAFLSCLSSFIVRYSGVLGSEEPHQSIPNVKLYCGCRGGPAIARRQNDKKLNTLYFTLTFQI
jgi:hypothetical protein